MKIFKSVVTTLLIYVITFLTLTYTVEQIQDVYKYADEALAIEMQCRDGNYDAANCYEVTKADDGSYTVQFAARGLDDLVVTSHYDKNGNYQFTDKQTSQYVISDIVTALCICALMIGCGYIIYIILVAIAETCVKLYTKWKAKHEAEVVVSVDENESKNDNQ